MNSTNYVELLTPRMDTNEWEEELSAFAVRYQNTLDAGFVVSVPDNPMGRPHFPLTEVIAELGLPVPPEQVILHVNTFHRKDDLDATLTSALELGVRHLLLVSGDGSERLPRLAPEQLGLTGHTVTSVELIRYVQQQHPDRFRIGVAFNQYEPANHELLRLRRKLDAGALFVITQPVVGVDARLDALGSVRVPIVLGAWMSRRLDRLEQCIGHPLAAAPDYNPLENLLLLRRRYPATGFYLALVGAHLPLTQLRAALAAA